MKDQHTEKKQKTNELDRAFGDNFEYTHDNPYHERLKVFDDFVKEKEGRYYFDLPNYLLEQCKVSGIESEDLGLDTYALKDDFFSYRRNTHEKLEDYGRQISVIGLY